MTTRRKFIHSTLAGSAAFAFSRYAGLAAAASASDSRIEILPNESLGTISPNIYGHFTEHLGGVIYDGIWVGPKSKVPNYDGLRRDLYGRFPRGSRESMRERRHWDRKRREKVGGHIRGATRSSGEIRRRILLR